MAAIVADGGVRNIRAMANRFRAHTGAPTTDFDPFDADVVADPYPAYRRLLAGPAVQYSRRQDLWVISHHDAVREALREHTVLSSAEGVVRVRHRLPMILTVDEPDHGRLRGIFARIFTPKAIADQRLLIERLVTRGLDDVIAGQDAVTALAVPLPVSVIAEMLGVPHADVAQFREWSDRIVAGFEFESLRHVLGVPRLTLVLTRLRRMIAGELEQPHDLDLLAGLQNACRDGTATDDEAFWFALLLLVAGNETTTNLIGTLLHALATHPEQYAMLRADPGLMPAAIAEALRWVSPIQGFYRTTTRPYREIPSDARVLLLFGAANRDPRRYREPDRFDITRDSGDQLAFGFGIHFCLGAHLARLEAQIVLEQLVQRVTSIDELAAPVWNRNPALRGPASLRVRLHSA